MAGVEECNRRQLGLALLLAGGALILVGVVLILHQQHLLEARAERLREPIIPGRLPTARIIQNVLFLLLLLVLMFGVASLAFLRFSRRFRRWLLRRPTPPTPADDVWAMHRLPPELDPMNHGSRPPRGPEGTDTA